MAILRTMIGLWDQLIIAIINFKKSINRYCTINCIKLITAMIVQLTAAINKFLQLIVTINFQATRSVSQLNSPSPRRSPVATYCPTARLKPHKGWQTSDHWFLFWMSWATTSLLNGIGVRCNYILRRQIMLWPFVWEWGMREQSVIGYLLSPICYLLSPVSCLLSAVGCRTQTSDIRHSDSDHSIMITQFIVNC